MRNSKHRKIKKLQTVQRRSVDKEEKKSSSLPRHDELRLQCSIFPKRKKMFFYVVNLRNYV